MESITSNIGATDKITNALATLRSEMLDLRQQDMQLMKQLMCINDNIQTLAGRRKKSDKPLRKKLALVNGRMSFVNIDEYMPAQKNRSRTSLRLCGSFFSIEDSCSSTEDLCSLDSDSEDSLCGSTQNH
ncbi:uncharacterized protein [Argopecten irradians]|uniref:uncharacterized protein n=1 Tax=Argopecten irradians TaxID=31199 RepID=UPI003712D5EE